MSTPVIVTNTEELQNLATQFTLAANHAGQVAVDVNSGIGLADLAISSAVDPAGAARFEATALQLLTGPFGLRNLEQHFMSICSSLGYAALDYVRADLAVQSFAGRFVLGLPMGAVDAVKGYRSDGWAGAGLGFLAGDTAISDTLMASVPLMTDVAGAEVGDGQAVVDDVGSDPRITRAPASVTDLVGNLTTLDDDRTKGAGDIDIQILAGTDAAGNVIRKVVVYLPGTDEKSFGGQDVNDLGGDVSAIGAGNSAYEAGLFAAMRSAGVTAADDVTMVGHSQGGMVAVNAARDAYKNGDFNVSHVVALGSPIGIDARGLPSSTRLLAVENKDDLIPQLDGTANPTRPNIATVKINEGPDDTSNWSGVLAQHDLGENYLPGTAGIEADDNDAIQSFTDSTGSLFHLDQVKTERYSITRQ